MSSAGGLYLPKVDFTVPNSVGVVTPREILEQSSTPIAEQQAQCAAYNTVLPVWYGTGRLGARLADPGIYQGRLVLFCVWGHGPLDGLVSWTIDDKPAPAGVIATHYDGSQVTVDPVLAAVYGAGYADVLTGRAYSVIQVPPGVTSGWPQVAAIWRGNRCYDPRTGLTVWTANRALWLADFLSSSVYGAGKTMDWPSVAEAADACDELVGGAPRRTGGGLVLDKRQKTEAWIETLRTYAGCAVIDEGGPVKLVANRPRTPVMDFSIAAENFISLAPLTTPEVDDIPTVVEVKYTDTSQIPWREASAFSSDDGLPPAGQPYRLSTVPLLGIHDASQAKREAVERRNNLNLCLLSTVLETYAEGTAIEPGDWVRLTYPDAGLNLKEFLVTHRSGSLGRYRLDLLETDPDQFSDVVVVASSQPDTAWPDPANPPAPTGLAVVEETYQLQDGRWTTRLRITWDAPDWVYLHDYRVVVAAQGHAATEGRPVDPVWVTGEVLEEMLYEVSVYCRSSMAESTAAFETITAQGKAIRPTNIETLTGYESGGEVRLTVGGSIDKDLRGLEVRFGAVGCTWEQAELLAFQATASGVGAIIVSRLARPGTWDFLACGRDSNKYSETPARLTLTVTLDTNSQLVDSFDSTSPTLTNMAEYRLAPNDARRYFVTEDGVGLSTKMPGALDQYSGALASHHAAVDSVWLGESEDFGLSLSGTWEITADVSSLGGDHVSSIGLGANGSDWTYTNGLTAKAGGRFGRIRHAANGAETLFVTVPTQNLRISAVPDEEFSDGVVTFLASGPTPIILTKAYADVTAPPWVTPIGASSRNYSIDNITVCPHEAYAGRGCFRGDGSSAYISVPTYAGINLAGGMTIEVLVLARTPPTAYACHLVAKHNSALSDWAFIAITQTTGYARLGMATGSVQQNVDGTVSLCDGRWHRVSAVFSSTQGSLYVDGAYIGQSPAISGPIATLDALLSIAARYYTAGWVQFANAQVADVRVWSTQRTAQQILGDAFTSLDGTETGLAGYWPVAEKSGTTVGNLVSGGNAGTRSGGLLCGVNGFDGRLFDGSGAQVSDLGRWGWKGVR